MSFTEECLQLQPSLLLCLSTPSITEDLAGEHGAHLEGFLGPFFLPSINEEFLAAWPEPDPNMVIGATGPDVSICWKLDE
jgi:hypothetical protein